VGWTCGQSSAKLNLNLTEKSKSLQRVLTQKCLARVIEVTAILRQETSCILQIHLLVLVLVLLHGQLERMNVQTNAQIAIKITLRQLRLHLQAQNGINSWP